MSKWIPVSEKLPERSTFTWHLVCLKNGHVCIGFYSLEGIFKCVDGRGIRKFSENNPVIAWMPLPEPYEEVQNAE